MKTNRGNHSYPAKQGVAGGKGSKQELEAKPKALDEKILWTYAKV